MKTIIFISFYLIFVSITNVLNAQSIEDSIKVPNVFSPNGDGINDVFKADFPEELEISEYNLTIYDRYGILIFNTNKKRQHWDGRTSSGQICSSGTYFYLLQINVSSQQIELKGFIQLFK